MEYVGETGQQTTQGFILCCDCGVQIEPNPANMCVACLRTKVDISEGIPKTGTLYFCKGCERYLQPPAAWIKAALESRELLSICLKKVKGLNKVRLVDAGFIWTEPHSKRVKVKLTIQKEVTNGAVLQQVFVIEYTVHGQYCDDCHRVEAKDYWRASVQVRQKTHHRKTLYYLEQLILRHKAHVNTTNITSATNGIDFYYIQKNDAKKLVDFLHAVVPCKWGTSQELISHDIHSNTFNYKTSFCVEIVPICKDNIVCLPSKLAQQLGNMGQICICHRVTTAIHLIDPSTLQMAEVSGTTFWRSPFSSLCLPKQLQEYVVMNVEVILDKDRHHIAGSAHQSQKHVLADAWVVKASELGVSDDQFHCRTHLGHLINPGDTVLGFDVRTANINDPHFEKLKPEKIPDVILVKKLYADPSRRIRKRKWKLHRLAKANDMETESVNRDYNDFLEDLEEDPAYRQNINIYKDANKVAVETDDSDGEFVPQISLQEMLDDLHIEDEEMPEDEDRGASAP